MNNRANQKKKHRGTSESLPSTVRSRRRFTAILTSDLPVGPQGQPAHTAGAELSVIHLVALPEVGVVSSCVPKPSALLRGAAEGHLKHARRMRAQLPKQVKRGQWIQPGYELQFSNEDLLFDFFEHGMASVLLLYAAIDAWANEQLPPELEWITPTGERISRAQVEGRIGLEKRLTQVLPDVTERESPAEEKPDAWLLVLELKSLRDAVAHVHLDETYTRLEMEPEKSVFSRLLATDLQIYAEAIDEVTSHGGQA